MCGCRARKICTISFCACELCGRGEGGEDGESADGEDVSDAAEYTKFWQDMAVETHLTKVEVPTLEVGGWWDQEDMWGTQAEYAALEPHDKEHDVFHGAGAVESWWMGPDGR